MKPVFLPAHTKCLNQAICIKLHGLNEYSTRLPSAVCALLTTLLLFKFMIYVTGNGWIALLAPIVLCTARGYIGYHGSRYGEYDTMLTLFSCAYLMAFFCYIEAASEQRKNTFLVIFLLALLLAIFTKSVAGLLFTPAVLIYAIACKQVIAILRNKYFYISTAVLLLIVLGYYGLHNHITPGYFQAVFDNELGGRFLDKTEGHSADTMFYLSAIKGERFGKWFGLLICTLPLLLLSGIGKSKRALFYSWLCLVCFLTVITVGKTKLPWYDLPLYPLMAIIISLAVAQLTYWVAGFIKNINKELIALVFCFLFSALPVYDVFQMIRYSYDELNNDSIYCASYYLRDAIFTNKDLIIRCILVPDTTFIGKYT